MPENKIREHQALANELSFLVGCGGGGWPGEVSDAQRQSCSAGVNRRARVSHHTPRSGHIALGIRHVHISPEAVLVSIEGRGEGAFRTARMTESREWANSSSAARSSDSAMRSCLRRAKPSKIGNSIATPAPYTGSLPPKYRESLTLTSISAHPAFAPRETFG